jgi:hypothetical protein
MGEGVSGIFFLAVTAGERDKGKTKTIVWK